jgi:hypothetical protein
MLKNEEKFNIKKNRDSQNGNITNQEMLGDKD